MLFFLKFLGERFYLIVKKILQGTHQVSKKTSIKRRTVIDMLVLCGIH